jgi:hypothetical protein
MLRRLSAEDAGVGGRDPGAGVGGRDPGAGIGGRNPGAGMAVDGVPVGTSGHRTRAAHLTDRAAGALALAALPLHVWVLVVHAHGLLAGAAIAVMVLACTVCGVHVLRGAAGCRPLWQLQLMSVAMVLAHAAMTAGLPGASTGGGGHHHAGRGAVVGNAPAMDGPILAIMGVELAVALCAGLALARRRRLGLG